MKKSSSLEITPQELFTDKQKKAFTTLQKALKGFSIKDAEEILFQLLQEIRTSSVIGR